MSRGCVATILKPANNLHSFDHCYLWVLGSVLRIAGANLIDTCG